jgi:hypothetical protein
LVAAVGVLTHCYLSLRQTNEQGRMEANPSPAAQRFTKQRIYRYFGKVMPKSSNINPSVTSAENSTSGLVIFSYSKLSVIRLQLIRCGIFFIYLLSLSLLILLTLLYVFKISLPSKATSGLTNSYYRLTLRSLQPYLPRINKGLL